MSLINEYFCKFGVINLPIDFENFEIVRTLKNSIIKEEITLNKDLLYIYGLYYETKKQIFEMYDYYRIGAELGDFYCCYRLGLLFEEMGDLKRMKFYYRLAFQKEIKDHHELLGNLKKDESPQGYFRLAFYYEKYDITKMIENYQIAGQKGFPQAFYNLGKYYQYIDKKEYEMKKYYLLAYKLGFKVAMRSLCEYKETLLKLEIEHCKNLYLKSHSKKDLSKLIYIYQNESNYPEMIKYLNLLIQQKDTEAMKKMAWYYQYISPNYEKMLEYYLMAARSGDIDGYYQLGLYNEYQTDRVGKVERMKNFYLNCIRKGHVWSMVNLGLFYRYVENNFKRAEKYLKMAEDNGKEGWLRHLSTEYWDEKEYNREENDSY